MKRKQTIELKEYGGIIMPKNTKRRLCILLCLAALLTFTLPAYAGSGIAVGGGKEEPTLKPSALEERYGKTNRIDGLTLTLERTEYSAADAVLAPVLQNKTGRNYGYSLLYWLERYEAGAWRSMARENVSPPAIGFVLKSGARTRFPNALDLTGAWKKLGSLLLPGQSAGPYGPLERGRYRLLTVLSEEDRSGNLTGEECLLAAEFTIVAAKTLYAAEPVYFRTGPGTKYKAAYELQTGEACTALGRSGNWMRVELADGRRGYVFAKYLTGDAGMQYYAHPLIAPLGAENIQSISVTDSPKDDNSIQNMGGAVLKGRAETCVRVELKRAYDCYAVRLYLFGNARAAQAAANALKRVHTMAADAPSYTYYRLEDAIVEWHAESRHDFSRKERVYADAVNEAFTELCGQAAAYLNG